MYGILKMELLEKEVMAIMDGACASVWSENVCYHKMVEVRSSYLKCETK